MKIHSPEGPGLTLGIDLSSMPKDTSACLLEWHGQSARVVTIENHCTDDSLDALHAEAAATGIDAPLGWPLAFRGAVQSWQLDQWSPGIRDDLCYRETDIFVRRHLGILPLSVSTDRIALPAMRAMAFLRRHGIKDRSGGEGVYEVYPAGALKAWGLAYRGYKKDPAGLPVRKRLLDRILAGIPVKGAGKCLDSGHAFDALIAAIVTREASAGRTYGPPSENSRSEGWIHLPLAWGPMDGREFNKQAP
jgi:predicted nuclease with RNAse H fold